MLSVDRTVSKIWDIRHNFEVIINYIYYYNTAESHTHMHARMHIHIHTHTRTYIHTNIHLVTETEQYMHDSYLDCVLRKKGSMCESVYTFNASWSNTTCSLI